MKSSQRIPWSEFSQWGHERSYVLDALDSTWVSGGVYNKRLEEAFENNLHLPHVLTVSNGTSALQLAFLGLGIKPGDEVIVPGFGFMAAANVLLQMNALPVFADVSKENWCLDPTILPGLVSSKTKAIVAIHNYGVAENIDAFTSFARNHNLILIEDCAESIFTKYRGQYCGTFGDVSTFSLHATKTISSGEGGVVGCSDLHLFNKMRLIRSHGLGREQVHYWHEQYGNNFRLSNVLAAIGLAQLEMHEKIIHEKQRVYRHYVKNLSDVKNITFQGYSKNCDPVIWAIAIKINFSGLNITRDGLLEHLLGSGIECRPGFYTPEQMPLYKKYCTSTLDVANKIASHVIVLPSHASLQNAQIDYICEKLVTAIS
ncbi:MAG: DegT/DnrJ/EryC1/StrS family aminotransferase [Sphingomonadales bacterium]|nr:DegT/DnrJ/EryC1/StrS family aminotransferase [Sphingomonadales bacterium]